jgi:hypothetical protein
MNGPSCTFNCTRDCWHACFIPMVKRSQIKGRCLYLLKRKESRRKKATTTNQDPSP